MRDRVREPMPGEIRLQWWRDVLNGERAGEAAANPVAAALIETIARFALPRRAAARPDRGARVRSLRRSDADACARWRPTRRKTASTLFELAARICRRRRRARSSSPARACRDRLRIADAAAARSRVTPRGARSTFRTSCWIVTALAPRTSSPGRATPDCAMRLPICAARRARHLSSVRSAVPQLPAAACRRFCRSRCARISLRRWTARLRPVQDPAVEIPQWRRQWTLGAARR